MLYDRLDSRWVDHDVLAVPADGSSAPPRLVVADHNFFDYRGGGSFGYPMASPDGKQVLFRSQRSGWVNYWVVPIDGVNATRRSRRSRRSRATAAWSPDGKWIAYVANHNGTKGLYVVSAAGGTPRALVAPAEGVVSKAAWSPEGSGSATRSALSATAADLYTVDVKIRQDHAADHLHAGRASRRPVWSPRARSRIRVRTDCTISAYLYEPRGLKPGEKAPGIMWVHGGPTGQWVDSYQPQVQYLVERGYAVLMPNIRGSAGLRTGVRGCEQRLLGSLRPQGRAGGRRLPQAAAIREPREDRDHGRSYGGCMSMSAIVNAPGVFQAAIPESGYGDWEAFLQFNDEMQHDQLLAYEFGPLAGQCRRLSPELADPQRRAASRRRRC